MIMLVETIFVAMGAPNTVYGEDESEDKMYLLRQALANLATTTSDLENKIRVDHTWQNINRVSCVTIKTACDLNEHVEALGDNYHALQARMFKLIQETLMTLGLNE